VSTPLLLAGLLLAAFQGKPVGIAVRVDGRVELFSILARLAGFSEYRQASEGGYLRDVDSWFQPFADHAAVQATREMRRRFGISYNAIPNLALHLGELPGLKLWAPLDPRPPGLDRRWPLAELPGYLDAVRDFVRVSRFEDFLARNRARFKALEAAFSKEVGKVALRPWCDAFFGPRPGDRFLVIPAPCNGPNNYSVTVALPGGGRQIHQVLGFPGWKGDTPLPGKGLVPLLVHETCHAYVNPLVERFSAAFEEAAGPVFRSVEPAMRAQAYESPGTLVSESCVRACTILYLKDTRGEEAAFEALRKEEGRSFLWIEPLVRRFEKYRSGPARKRGFEAFFPGIADFFRDWWKRPAEEREPPFRGPINAVFLRYKSAEGTVLIAPGEKGPTRDYAQGIHRQLFLRAGVPLLSPGEAGPAILASRTLVLYGSSEDNSVLARVLEALDFEISGKGIRMGSRKFAGPGLVLIACHPSPWNPRRAVLLYVGPPGASLAGINDLFHGPTDWLVARRAASGRFQVVEQGDFPKDLAGNWKP